MSEVSSEAHRSGLWAWNVSALFYKRTYGPLAHEIDDALFAWLGDLGGLVVADVGCGPGVVTAKLADRGAARVYAIDVSPGMLAQVPPRETITTVRGRVEDGVLDGIAEVSGGFDVVLFKRSLYQPRDQALEVLKAAWRTLRPGGRVAVIHPEASVLDYAFGAPRRLHRHTPYHLFNRTISRIGVMAGGETYQLYSRDDLVALASEVAGFERVEAIPSAQRAFNLVGLRKPAES